MVRAPRIWASSISSLPWAGETLIRGKPAASLACSAASRAESGRTSTSEKYWSTAAGEREENWGSWDSLGSGSAWFELMSIVKVKRDGAIAVLLQNCHGRF